MEVIFTILSTVGTIGLAISLKLIQWLATPFESAANELAKRKEPTVESTATAVSNPGKKAHMSRQQQTEYSRVLLQAIVEGDKGLTIAMAERINGSKYLTTEKPKVSPGGFPVSKGGD